MSDRHPSILRVLGWRLAFVSLVFLLLAVAVLQSKLQTAADELFHHALEDEARSVSARITHDQSGAIGFLPLNQRDQGTSIIRYRVLNERGDVLFASADPRMDAILPKALSEQARAAIEAGGEAEGEVRFFRFEPPVSRNRILVAMLGMPVGERHLVIEVFVNLDDRGVLLDDLVSDFFVQVGWLLIPFVALLLAVNLLSVWSGLRPLTRVSRMAAGIGPRTTARRLPEEGQPSEILPLIQSVNRALERLDEGFQMQRQFTADAAHELRTPLAVLSAHLGTLGDAKAVASLRQEVAVMSRFVGQLLRIAQLDSLSLDIEALVDLHEIAVEAASSLAPLALQAGKSIAVTGVEDPVPVHGDSEALGQAIRNLIENALTHTPKGTTVEIEIGADRSVRVTDAGPGVSPEHRKLIFQRFWRADRRKGGAGLGLAIVAKVAETHGGTIHVEDGPSGKGATFVLQLPPPKPEATMESAHLPQKDTAAA